MKNIAVNYSIFIFSVIKVAYEALKAKTQPEDSNKSAQRGMKIDENHTNQLRIGSIVNIGLKETWSWIIRGRKKT